jgi:hypothetical protein
MRGRRGITDVPWLGDEGGSAAILVMEEREVASMMTAIFSIFAVRGLALETVLLQMVDCRRDSIHVCELDPALRERRACVQPCYSKTPSGQNYDEHNCLFLLKVISCVRIYRNSRARKNNLLILSVGKMLTRAKLDIASSVDQC